MCCRHFKKFFLSCNTWVRVPVRSIRKGSRLKIKYSCKRKQSIFELWTTIKAKTFEFSWQENIYWLESHVLLFNYVPDFVSSRYCFPLKNSRNEFSSCFCNVLVANLSLFEEKNTKLFARKKRIRIVTFFLFLDFEITL